MRVNEFFRKAMEHSLKVANNDAPQASVYLKQLADLLDAHVKDILTPQKEKSEEKELRGERFTRTHSRPSVNLSDVFLPPEKNVVDDSEEKVEEEKSSSSSDHDAIEETVKRRRSTSFNKIAKRLLSPRSSSPRIQQDPPSSSPRIQQETGSESDSSEEKIIEKLNSLSENELEYLFAAVVAYLNHNSAVFSEHGFDFLISSIMTKLSNPSVQYTDKDLLDLKVCKKLKKLAKHFPISLIMDEKVRRILENPRSDKLQVLPADFSRTLAYLSITYEEKTENFDSVLQVESEQGDYSAKCKDFGKLLTVFLKISDGKDSGSIIEKWDSLVAEYAKKPEENGGFKAAAKSF